jgi:hypothetical protein
LWGKEKPPIRFQTPPLHTVGEGGMNNFTFFFSGDFRSMFKRVCVCKIPMVDPKKQNERFENEKTGVSDVMNKHFEMQTQHKLQHTETQNSAAPKSFSFKF